MARLLGEYHLTLERVQVRSPMPPPPAAAGAAPLTFEQAAAKATSTKGCPKKMVDVIETVDVVKDPGAKGLFLSVCDAACPSLKLTGPLAATPTTAQLESLKGKPLCLSADWA